MGAGVWSEGYTKYTDSYSAECWDPLGSDPWRVHHKCLERAQMNRNTLDTAKQQMTDRRSQKRLLPDIIILCMTRTRKYEPQECRGFDSLENSAELGKCQCVSMFKGCASSVTCMLADAKQRIIGIDTGSLSDGTEIQVNHTHTHTQTPEL